MNKSIIFLSLLVFVLSCNNKQSPNTETFDRLYGTKLFLSQNLENINDTIKNTEDFFKKPVKIVSDVFFGCGDCIGNLQKLNDFVDFFHSDKIALIVYGNTDRSNTGIYAFLTIVPDFKYPIYSDTSNVFIKQNNLPEDNMVFHTFLVDKNDSVRVIGSPVGNKKIADLYIQEIKKIFEED